MGYCHSLRNVSMKMWKRKVWRKATQGPSLLHEVPQPPKPHFGLLLEKERRRDYGSEPESPAAAFSIVGRTGDRNLDQLPWRGAETGHRALPR